MERTLNNWNSEVVTDSEQNVKAAGLLASSEDLLVQVSFWF